MTNLHCYMPKYIFMIIVVIVSSLSQIFENNLHVFSRTHLFIIFRLIN